jgi:hypothetical protein
MAPSKISGAHTIEYYGWVADLPDQRDFLYAAPTPVQRSIPPKMDLHLAARQFTIRGSLAVVLPMRLPQQLQKRRFVPSLVYSSTTTSERWKERSTAIQVLRFAMELRALLRWRTTGALLAVRHRQV